MFTGNPVGVMVLYAYISLAALIILFLLSQIALASKKFRALIGRKKITSILILAILVTLSWPVFIGVYKKNQQYTQMKEKLNAEFGHHIFEANTTVDGITFPVGTKVKFTRITFPHETAYQGLPVKSVEIDDIQNEVVKVMLAKPQLIDGWWCETSSPVKLNFKKNKGYQLHGCKLSDGNEVSGIKLPSSLWLGYTSGFGEPAWYVYSNTSSRWSDQYYNINGLKFTIVRMRLTAERNKADAFQGELGKPAKIQARQYAAGDTITLEDLLAHSKEKQRE